MKVIKLTDHKNAVEVHETNIGGITLFCNCTQKFIAVTEKEQKSLLKYLQNKFKDEQNDREIHEQPVNKIRINYSIKGS